MISELINKLVKADPEEDKLFIESEHTKTMMVSGFLKSTSGTAFISLGTGVLAVKLFEFLLNNYPQYFYQTAILLIVTGLIIYFLGDIYEIYKEKNRDRQRDKHFEDRAVQIARNLIEDEDKERDERIENKMSKWQKELCNHDNLEDNKSKD